MPLTLYGPSTTDFRLQKLRVAAQLAGVELKVVQGEQALKAAKELSPFQQPPVLVLEDGSAVPRTNAILRTLASLREDLSLRGYTTFDEAAVEQWLDWAFYQLEPLAMVLTVGETLSGMAPEMVKAAKAAATSKLGPELHALEKGLATKTYLVGERISLADVSTAVVVAAVWGVLDAKVKAELPHVTRWLLTCRHHDAFVSVLGSPDKDGGSAAPAAAAAPKQSGGGKGGKGGAAKTSGEANGSGASSGAGATPAATNSSSSSSSSARAAAGPRPGLPTALTAFDTFLPVEKYGRNRQRIADVLHGELSQQCAAK